MINEYNYKKEIGARLKLYRETQKYNQKDFSSKLGIKQESLSRYESGNQSVPDEIKLKLSKENVNIDWLITGRGEMFIKDSNTLKQTEYSSNENVILSNTNTANDTQDEHITESSNILSKEYETISYQTNLFLEDSYYMLDNEEENQNTEIIKILNTELETSKAVKLPDELKNIEDRLAAIVQYSDDMEPSIKKGSIVIFDVAGGFQGDNIYAVKIKGLYTIKRIFLNIDGSYTISNEKSRTFNVEKETENFIIGGLVRAVLTMM